MMDSFVRGYRLQNQKSLPVSRNVKGLIKHVNERTGKHELGRAKGEAFRSVHFYRIEGTQSVAKSCSII